MNQEPFFFPTVWVTVASVTAQAATAVAYVQVFPKKDTNDGTYEAAGTIDLERLQATQLFRFNVYKEDGSILTSLPLAVDHAFDVEWCKVKGKTSRRGVQITITFEQDFSEGYEKLVIRIPFDGNNGSAVLMAGACEHAGRVVKRAVDQLQAIELSNGNNRSVAATASSTPSFVTTAPSTQAFASNVPPTMPAPTGTPGTVSMSIRSDFLSPMSIG